MLAAALFLPALAACGGDAGEGEAEESSGPPVPKVGQCFASEVREGEHAGPSLWSAVPCTDRHAYEVTGVIDVPERFLDETSPAASLKRRDDLARPGGPKTLHGKLARAADCEETRAQMMGTRDFAVKRKVGSQAILPEVNNAAGWMNVAPRELWTSGHHVVICSWRFGGVGRAVPVASPDDRPALAHVFDASFPVDNRNCYDVAYEWTSCAGPHRFEAAFRLQHDPLLGVDLESLSARDARMKAGGLCGAVLILAGHDVDGVRPIPVLRENETVCFFEPEKDGVDFPAGFQTFS